MAEYEQSETGNWNTAQNWSNEMIFKPLFEASQYLIVAKFGCSNIEEDFMFDEQTKIQSRIKAISWAKEKLNNGISQSIFAVRNDSDKKILARYLVELEDLDKVIDLILVKQKDRDKIRITINEDYFKIAYNCLKRIFKDTNEPLNRADLIFNYREQFDPKKFKQKITDDIIESG
jgi:hypothetical protein